MKTTTASRHNISYRQFGTQGQERVECICGFCSPVLPSHTLAVEATVAHLSPTYTCEYCGGGHKTNLLCWTR